MSDDEYDVVEDNDVDNDDNDDDNDNDNEDNAFIEDGEVNIDNIDDVEKKEGDVDEDNEAEEEIEDISIEEDNKTYAMLKPKDVDDVIEEIVIIAKEDRETSNILNLFEFTEATSVRAAQIATGSPSFVKSSSNDPIKIAEQEIFEKRSPFIVNRFVGLKNNISYYEQWSINEMELHKAIRQN